MHARVDEADIGKVRRDQQVNFSVDAYPGQQFQGTVNQIRKAPEITQNVVVYSVVISASNPDEKMLPGMTAQKRGHIINISSSPLQPSRAYGCSNGVTITAGRLSTQVTLTVNSVKSALATSTLVTE